jgi:membrane protease YdiL (CAAX protease family)
MTSTENLKSYLPQTRHAISFFLLIIVVEIVTGIAGFVVAEADKIRIETHLSQSFDTIIATLLTIGLIWVYIKLKRFDGKPSLYLYSCRLAAYFWAVIGIISLGIVVRQLGAYLVHAVPWLLPEELLDLMRLMRFTEWGSYLLFAITASLGPGLSEELAFRGFILRGLSSRFRPLWAVTLSAFLFALLHVFPLLILMAFPVGLYLGYVVVRTGSLYPAILAHVTFNLWSIVETSLWQAYSPELEPAAIMLSAYSPIIIATAVSLLAVGLYALHQQAYKQVT